MNYDDLITRYLQNTANSDEYEQLLAWIKSNDENRQQFDLAVAAWHTSGLNASNFDVNKAYRAFTEKKKTTATVVELKSNKRWLRRAMQFAAVVTLAIGAYWAFSPSETIEHKIIANINNDVQTVSLPDGSKVYLNTGAKIEYPANFDSDIREISLTGEAFFEVTRNESKPFVVQTHQGAVKVLGTSFSVIDDSLSGNTRVIVETGKVRLSNNANDEYIDLLPGQSGDYALTSNSLTKAENADPNYASWHTGRLTFKNTDLKSVIACLQRHYKKEIHLQSEKAANCKFTARFDHEPIENVFKMLELTFSLKVSNTNNIFIVDGDGC